MSNYAQDGNRYTAIFLRAEDGTLTRVPYDVVRFNVDENPKAQRDIVPHGGKDDHGKIFERVWIVDQLPWAKKVNFNGLS